MCTRPFCWNFDRQWRPKCQSSHALDGKLQNIVFVIDIGEFSYTNWREDSTSLKRLSKPSWRLEFEFVTHIIINRCSFNDDTIIHTLVNSEKIHAQASQTTPRVVRSLTSHSELTFSWTSSTFIRSSLLVAFTRAEMHQERKFTFLCLSLRFQTLPLGIWRSFPISGLVLRDEE